MSATGSYLPDGLPIPVPEPDGLSEPHWSGLRRGELLVQRCKACRAWRWGPEWICHACHSFETEWAKVEPQGTIFSWTRVWHPTHPALNERGPYVVVVVELPQAGNVRVIGNLVGDAHQPVGIGAKVKGVFEQHDTADPPYGLLHWRTTDG